MVNIDSIAELLVSFLWAAPLVTGLVQVVKVTLGLDEHPRFIPLTALVIGVGVGVLLVGVNVPAVVVGAIVGLSSVGLYEVGKTTIVGGRG